MSLFVPRTFPEIVGEMQERLISVTPITDLNFGAVAFTMLEAAAQEDDEQYFQMLEIIRGYSLDTTTGSDLDNRAFEYGLERLQAQVASTNVTLGDSAVTKVSTGVYSGLPGASAGSTSVNGDSSTGFPVSGSIIVGRGTPNAETITYVSITDNGNYVTFNLGGALAFDHGTDETIILSQAGNRVVPAGTVVKVPASDVNPEITFTLDAIATILDGESELTGVAVTAAEAGSKANVPVGSIIQYDSPPFSTATVTNPSRVTNGRDIESDQELRDRIKDRIQSLSRGTGVSIITNVIGVISDTENKRVVSASLVEPTIPADVVRLFIDDGTGFVATFAGVGYEEVVPSATGGEVFLNINNFPITKAFVETQNQEPYNLVGGETLIVDVGGKIETITFESTDFAIAGQATAQEVLKRINGAAQGFESRVSSGGVKIRIFARQNFDEAIRVTGGTANTALNFVTDKKFTTKVYLERDLGISLLNKDGSTATMESGNAQVYDFSALDRVLSFVVDGKKNVQLAWFRPADFLNPPSATALEVVQLINEQISGLIASRSSNNTRVSLTSNTIRSSTSKLQIVENFTRVLKFNGAFTNITAQAIATAADAQIFDANGDILYLGHSTVQFRTAFFSPQIPASAPMGYDAEYWNGSSWTALPVFDGTLGFTVAGHFEFQAPHDWEINTVDSFDAYWIRFVRNDAGLVTPPTEDRIRISSANELLAFPEIAAEGSNRDYTLNRFLGQIELIEPLNPGDFVTIGSFNTRAFVVTAAQTFNLVGGETLNISVDGVPQVVTFQIADFGTPSAAVASEVLSRINKDLKGATATLVELNTKVKIASNKWNGGTIQVTGGTAVATLGLDTDLHESFSPHVPAVESGNAEPYVFNADDQVIVIVDGNLANNFTVPLYTQRTTGAGSSASQIVDATLNTVFPLNADLTDYDVEMISGPEAGNRRNILSYNAGTGTIIFDSAFGSSVGTGQAYQIIPTNADQVVRFWNNTKITLLSTRAEVKTSSGGVKVQIASLSSGDASSIQVSGGTGNTVLNFSTATRLGVDGYRHYTGLAQIAQWTIDGRQDDQETYPGYRAAGVQIEVLEPVRIPIRVELDVTTREGITLSSISNDIKSAVSTYINTLPVGEDVIVSSITCAVKEVDGVFDVTVAAPTANIAIADNELARISDSEIIVG
jgi:uncharacterized phage protein gp47/JayE